MRRNTMLGIGIAVVVAASAVGWVAGRQIQSPAEIASKTAPPDPSLISVPVEKRTLASDVVVRGTVRYGSPQVVSLPASALKLGKSIVTTAPVNEAALNEGTVALTVSGRPVLVLQGAQPAYRDLGPGAEGTDVRQLEEALARLGHNPGAVDGRYDARTSGAVTALYRASGFAAFGPTQEQSAALALAEGEQFAARSEQLSAQESLTAARGALTNARALQAAANGPQPPEKTPAQVAQERAAANAEVAQATEAVDLAQRRVSLTSGRVTTTGTEVGAIRSKLGVQIPADEVLFFPGLPLRVSEATVKAGEEVAGPIMTVSNSLLAVDGALAVNDAKLVRKGAAVAIEEPDLGIRLTGLVSEIADKAGTRGVDPQRYYLEVTPVDAPAALVGASVVLTITVRSTEGEVLAVPIGALSVAADSTSRVQVLEKDGATRYVTVTPGLSAKGLVAVTPVKGALAVGDLVVVGKGGRGDTGRSGV